MSPIEVLIDLLGSDPEDLHGAHSGAPGNRRNIGSRNKRLLRTSRASPHALHTAMMAQNHLRHRPIMGCSILRHTFE
jgi:hypothetical protein